MESSFSDQHIKHNFMSESSKEEIIMAKLKSIVEESATEPVDLSNFGPDTTVEDIGLDSLTILDLLYDIEQEIGVEVEAKEIIAFRTIGEITQLLVDKGA